jgi:hypothetical protein
VIMKTRLSKMRQTNTRASPPSFYICGFFSAMERDTGQSRKIPPLRGLPMFLASGCQWALMISSV